MRLALLACLLLLAFLAAPAHATTVAYIDGDAVWIAAPDGSKRHQLSGPAGDGRVWRELTQSDNGRVLAVRREPGKISQLNSFTLWGPDGAVIYHGSLTHQLGWSSYAYPITLDLTADGRNVVYGFSNSRGIVPNAQFDSGTYIIYADRIPASEPFRIPDQKWPTVVGDRLVTAGYGGIVSVQRATGQPPFSTDFDPWLDASSSLLDLTHTDVAASGTIAATELHAWNGGTMTESKIAMTPVGGLGGDVKPGSCFLPAQGLARDPSLSQDGTLVAWKDDRGIVVAGVPDFSGGDPCTLTKPPVVISATGTMPSLGAAAIPVTPPPVPPAGGGGPGGTTPPESRPAAKLAQRVKAAALRRGVAMKVTVGAAGRVTAVGRVGGKVVARGKATAKRAGTVTLRLKATRKRLARLRGKTLVVRITGPGGTATLRRTLR